MNWAIQCHPIILLMAVEIFLVVDHGDGSADFWVFSAATPTSISRGLYLLLKVSSKGLKSCCETAAENIIQSFSFNQIVFFMDLKSNSDIQLLKVGKLKLGNIFISNPERNPRSLIGYRPHT